MSHYKPYKHRRINGKMYDVHILIWTEAHGRPVPHGCHIHHKDGDRWNNDPSNLICLTIGEHRSFHAKKQKRDCGGRFSV